MKIILDTILGLLLILGLVAGLSWLFFREQFHRLIQYFRNWAEQDAKREQAEKRVEQELEDQRRQELMREASSREKAEAELDSTLNIGSKEL